MRILTDAFDPTLMGNLDNALGKRMSYALRLAALMSYGIEGLRNTTYLDLIKANEEFDQGALSGWKMINPTKTLEFSLRVVGNWISSIFELCLALLQKKFVALSFKPSSADETDTQTIQPNPVKEPYTQKIKRGLCFYGYYSIGFIHLIVTTPLKLALYLTQTLTSFYNRVVCPFFKFFKKNRVMGSLLLLFTVLIIAAVVCSTVFSGGTALPTFLLFAKPLFSAIQLGIITVSTKISIALPFITPLISKIGVTFFMATASALFFNRVGTTLLKKCKKLFSDSNTKKNRSLNNKMRLHLEEKKPNNKDLHKLFFRGKALEAPIVTTTTISRNNETLLKENGLEHIDIPERFTCSLMCTVMTDPVALPDGTGTGTGTIVDRKTILKNLKIKQENPFTRQAMTIEDVTPDTVLKQEIDNWVNQTISSFSLRFQP